VERAGHFGYFLLAENTRDIMGGWEGEGKRMSHISFFVFSFKAEDTLIWEVI